MTNPYERFLDQIDLYLGRENVKNILEAGACNCEDSVKMTQYFPNATVHAFECNPETLPLCRTEAKNEPRIVLRETALGDFNGEKVFFPIDTKNTVTVHADGNPGASSFYMANKDYDFEKYVQTQTVVPIARVDSLELPPIDLLWLDAQGAELSILKGMGDKLKEVKFVKIELLFKPQYIGAPLSDEVEAFLEENGFRFVRYIDKYEWFGDAFFVNNTL